MPFKYYDVETGEEREVEHGRSCVCGVCTKARLKSVLDDIITSHRAFAPSAKRKVKSSPKHTRFDDLLFTRSYHGESTLESEPETNEGKCFGWNPEADRQIYLSNEEDVYMHLDNKPLSPDMTKNDMAVMSVDQAKAVLTLKVLYNPFFNQRLKERVEPKYRNWNLANKCWELHPSTMKDVQQICQEFYKGVQIIGQKPVLGSKFEKLLTKLTKDDKQNIYRLMALKYHPDKGGDHETMSLLNEVFKQ